MQAFFSIFLKNFLQALFPSVATVSWALGLLAAQHPRHKFFYSYNIIKNCFINQYTIRIYAI